MKAGEEMRAWRQWRACCALALLSEAERLQLTGVIAQRFRSMVRKINLHGSGGLTPPPEADCAHLFESYCAMHRRRDGKKYKHWLLTRGRRDLDTVQSGVMMLVRNVVGEWIRDCCPQTAPVSLQQPLGEGGRPVTLEQLLPDPAPPSRSEGQCAWIASKTGEMLQSLNSLQRTVLLLRAREMVFSSPAVRRDYGYGKTALHQAHRDLLLKLAEEVGARFPGLRPEEGTGMVLDVMDALGRKILSEISAENPESAAFGKERCTE